MFGGGAGASVGADPGGGAGAAAATRIPTFNQYLRDFDLLLHVCVCVLFYNSEPDPALILQNLTVQTSVCQGGIYKST